MTAPACNPCTGECRQGRDFPHRPIKTLEEAHPWVWLVYALVMGLAVFACWLSPMWIHA